MGCKLIIGGCDDVDRFVRRHGANVQKATAVIHSMISTWLHFDAMRREKVSDTMLKIHDELVCARVDLAVSATKGVCGTSLDARVQEIKHLEAEYERLQLMSSHCEYCGTTGLSHDLDCPKRGE